jgi:opacity protein-like surface antigen
MDMRIMRIIAPWLLFLFFTCSWASAQDPPPRLEVFAEGGGSFLSNGTLGGFCSLGGCSYFPIGFSNGGRLFAGARFRVTRRDAIEASYSYSHNSFASAAQSNRLDVISFNYVRYLGIKARLQPFATAGIGANRLGGLVNLGYPSDNGFHFAWNYGAGADIVLQGRLALRLELRDYVGGQPSFITGTSHNIVPSAGIVFRLK